MREHVSAFHEGMRYQCPVDGCDRVYSYSRHLNDHLKANHRQSNDFHEFAEMPVAEESSSRVSDRQCPQCGKQFKSPCFLREHVAAIHEGMRLQCPVVGCDRVYSYKRHLKDHLQAVHKQNYKIFPRD